jgi:4-diphosphocytidyl-2-C-methyl-D-erythritol kinase
MNGPLRIHAPCKLNLHLAVGGLRPDGFHNLESIFALLEFGDTLELTLGEGDSGKTCVETAVEGPFLELSPHGDPSFAIPAEKNLVNMAVELFRSRGFFKKDLALRLVKRIPPGSGLGGGSSDAAAALLALNGMADRPLPFEGLLSLGEKLGSDVPFFLYRKGAAVVSGRGERVVPVKSPPRLPVLLVFPGFPSSTPEAFALLDKVRAQNGDTQERNVLTGMETFLFEQGPERWQFTNDFLSILHEKELYMDILRKLSSLGASCIGLSGSGSTCFGVFNNNTDAEKAKAVLAGEFICIEDTFFLRAG